MWTREKISVKIHACILQKGFVYYCNVGQNSFEKELIGSYCSIWCTQETILLPVIHVSRGVSYVTWESRLEIHFDDSYSSGENLTAVFVINHSILLQITPSLYETAQVLKSSIWSPWRSVKSVFQISSSSACNGVN